MTRRTAALAAVLLVAACDARPRLPEITPTPRYATAAAVVDDRVYVVGGVQRDASGDRTVATVEAYDPEERRWTRCAPMPTARCFSAAGALDGKLYVFGGLDAGGKALATVEAYDPAKDAWSACPPMDRARSRFAATPRRDIHAVFVGGGLDASERNMAEVRIFLPKENVWRQWPDLPAPRHALALIDAADETERVLAVGGFDGHGPLSAVDVFGVGPVSAFDERGKRRWRISITPDGMPGPLVPMQEGDLDYTWRPGPPLADARGFFGLARIGRRVYAVGGRCPAVPRTEVLDLDDVAAGWKPAAPLPRDLCRFALVEWHGRLLAFGGETEFGKAVNADVFEYDPSADAWSARRPR